MTIQERLDNYHKETGYPEATFIGADGRIVGIWVMGNLYTARQDFYGSYPHGYLKRIKALFPDKRRILHVFSGKVDLEPFSGPGQVQHTVDSNPDLEPDYLDDAQRLEKVPGGVFDLVLADPPYSVEDCEHYGCSMVRRNLVMKALAGIMSRGTHVVWLDQVLPQYRKKDWKVIGYIGMVKSTNHRFRVVTIFEKV